MQFFDLREKLPVARVQRASSTCTFSINLQAEFILTGTSSGPSDVLNLPDFKEFVQVGLAQSSSHTQAGMSGAL